MRGAQNSNIPASEDLHLCVDNNPDSGAVLLHLGQILLDLFLAQIIGPLGTGLSESLLLRLGPIMGNIVHVSHNAIVAEAIGKLVEPVIDLIKRTDGGHPTIMLVELTDYEGV